MESAPKNARLMQAAHDVTLSLGLVGWVIIGLLIAGRYQVSWQSTSGEQFTTLLNAVEEAPKRR